MWPAVTDFAPESLLTMRGRKALLKRRRSKMADVRVARPEFRFRTGWKPKAMSTPVGQWKESIAKGSIASGTMINKGGDNDVFTKDGRTTKVTLKARSIRLSDDGTAFLVDVYYEVYEVHEDHTRLVWEGTARCPIPTDQRKGSTVPTDVRDYDLSWPVNGEEHGTLPLDNTDGTCVDAGAYRIDGGGDGGSDDRDVAGVELSLRVPFRYFDTAP
jgi:hypothetical protein